MIPFHPYADIFPLIEGAEFEALVADIRAHGLREPIVILDGQILDGRNRYRAAIEARVYVGDVGIPQRDFSAEFEGDPLDWVISKNVLRRHLNESQRAMAAAKIETLKQGRPRADAGKPEGAGEKQANLRVSRADAAKRLNVSPRSVTSAAVVRDQAEPELRLAVEQGHLKVSAAAKAVVMTPEQQRAIAVAAGAGKSNVVKAEIKKASRNAREAELGAKQTALTPLNQLGAKFGVIVADPEWRFEVWGREGGLDRSADNHYPTSDAATIAVRDVASIAAEDCVLGLWVTDLARGIDTLRGWGFAFKSYFVWVKDIVEVELTPEQRRAGNDADRHFVTIGPAGTGYWNLDRDELLLIGTRGNPVCPAPGTQGESTWFAARPRDMAGKIIHSAKPECCLAWFDKHFPSVPKIELNARRGREGWVQWGNEAPVPEGLAKEESSGVAAALSPAPISVGATQIEGMPPAASVNDALASVRRMME